MGIGWYSVGRSRKDKSILGALGDVARGAGDVRSDSGESNVWPVIAGEGGKLVLIAGVGGLSIEEAAEGGLEDIGGKGLEPY